ncbi:MAG: ATP-dependent sacrificial sulfur transferase LarE [Anaerolineaceae bacterium]|nr:ATP-dependent sacrificial sulfur transferase LarE [Anaerolineaceae bacterium]
MTDPDSGTFLKWKRLIEWLQNYSQIGVALSGGVDSALVCAAAVQALGTKNVTAYTIESPMEIPQEVEDARQIAENLGVDQFRVPLDELEIEEIRSNPSKRCYFCKRERLKIIKEQAHLSGITHLVDGSNADDLSDYRPGRQALLELGVLSPLAEVGITKAEVRQLAKWQGIQIWNKPSTPCLASRFPYGIEINHQRLHQVACAEEILKNSGFTELRVRYHESVARIEVPVNLLESVLADREEIVRLIKNCGFLYVTLDLQGFRSGSMNEGLI